MSINITEVRESISEFGGQIIYHDGTDSPFHIFPEYKTSRANKMREALKSYKGEIMPKAEVQKIDDAETKARSEAINKAFEDMKAKKIEKVKRLVKLGFNEEAAKLLLGAE